MGPISTEINQKVYRELSFKSLLSYALFIVVGIAGVIAGVFFGRVLGYTDLSVIVIFVACSLLVVMGGAFILYLVVRWKKALAHKLVIETTFSDEGVHFIQYKDDQKAVESDSRYSELLFYRETNEYVYLFPNKITAIPIGKCDGLIAYLDEKGIKRRKF